MEQKVYPCSLKSKMVSFLIEEEETITRITVFCTISAFSLGMFWLFSREMMLLYLSMGLSSRYFIGKKLWRFRHGVVLQSPPSPEQGEKIS